MSPFRRLPRNRGARRLITSAVLLAGLVLVPGASFAGEFIGTPGDDALTGTPNDDLIVGDTSDTGAVFTGGDDVLTGGAGDDTIYGEAIGIGLGQPADITGGDDIIEGGAGDDVIRGDGIAVGVEQDAIITGGDDVIHGGSGNDVIYGEGEATEVVGDQSAPGLVTEGNDQLFGGLGDDELYGQSGADLLCGLGGGVANAEDDVLEGGEGSDLACAVDDDVTVSAGEQVLVDLAVNDEKLDDEGLEDGQLHYALVGGMVDGIIALLDELTGELTVTAECDAVLRYEVTREGNPFATQASVDIEVRDAGACVEPDAKPASVEPTVSQAAVLPDTGAGSGLRAIGALGAALTAGGCVTIGWSRRRSRVLA
jgi:hypothetical protein